MTPSVTDAEAYGTCVHRAPSPGQSMCQCGHMQIEMQFVRDIVERSGEEIE